MDLLDLIDKKITDGFLGLNTRLDLLNGQTRRHGEDIAVLKHETKKLELLEEEVQKAILAQTICSFNCPWKSQMDSMIDGKAAQDLVVSKRAENIKLAKVGLAGAGVGALILEILPNVLDWMVAVIR
jgi:hypothetical protein